MPFTACWMIRLQKLRCAIDAAKDGEFDKRAEDADCRGCKNGTTPESGHAAADVVVKAHAQVRAEHEERAVGEVHDARDAENERQAERDEKQQRCAREAVQRLDEE